MHYLITLFAIFHLNTTMCMSKTMTGFDICLNVLVDSLSTGLAVSSICP